MDVDRLIDQNHPESADLEYKHPDEDVGDIVKELVSLANSGGGRLVIGVAEDDGEINSLAPVENTGEFEEQIQQKIRSYVTPSIAPAYTVTTYTGDWDEYHGIQLAEFTIESTNRIYAFRIDSDLHVFPTRQGSVVQYMNGQEVADFYENKVYPGHDKGISETDRSGQSRPFAQIAEAVNEQLTVGGDDDSTSLSEQPDEEDPFEFTTSQPPYYFTPTGDYTAVSFYFMVSPYAPYGFEGVSTHIDREEVGGVLLALDEYLNADLESGAFTIAQRNGAWFGQGAGNFLRALDQSDRYDPPNPDYDLDTHHSEGTVFLTRIDGGYTVVRARDSIRSDYVDEFNVSFLTEGVPLDDRRFIGYLEETGLELGNGYEFDVQGHSYHPASGEHPLTVVDRLESRTAEGWVGRLVCQNPFYDDPELLRSLIDDDHTWERYNPLTTYEQVLCRLSNHHPMEESKEYHLRQANLQALTEVQGSIPHINASLQADW